MRPCAVEPELALANKQDINAVPVNQSELGMGWLLAAEREVILDKFELQLIFDGGRGDFKSERPVADDGFGG